MFGEETLGKPELCAKIAVETGLPLRAVNKFFDAYHNVIMHAVYEGDTVQVSGFGKFYRRLMPERYSTHPVTGKEHIALPRMVPRFKAGEKFKRVVGKRSRD